MPLSELASRIFYMKHSDCLVVFVLLFMISACKQAPDSTNEKPAQQAAEVLSQEVLRLYTTQHLPEDDSLYNAFQQTYNISVEVTEVAHQDLLKRLQSEQENESADVVIFPEVGLAATAKSMGLLQFHPVPELDNYYKSMARDEEGYWTGLSRIYPAIAYAHEEVSADGIESFFDLGRPALRGTIILPPADDPLLLSLTASFLIHNGRPATTRWLNQLINNAGGTPIEGDQARLKALAAGKGKYTIASAGSLGRLRYPPTYQELVEAQSVKLVIPANGDFNTHVNISCAAVPKGGNLNRAVALIKFLTSESNQARYAGYRHEFPVNVMAMPSEFIIEEMGGVREDELELETLVSYHAQAKALLEELNWPE
jgi:iron(III) transport system substrate-binding protein